MAPALSAAIPGSSVQREGVHSTPYTAAPEDSQIRLKAVLRTDEPRVYAGLPPISRMKSSNRYCESCGPGDASG
jgi:hypothetical protein